MPDKVASLFSVPVLGFTVLFLLAGCEAGGDRDMGGTLTKVGEWETIDEKQSNIHYMAEKKSNI